MASFPHFHFDPNLSILISYRNKSQWKSLIENIDSSEGIMIEAFTVYNKTIIIILKVGYKNRNVKKIPKNAGKLWNNMAIGNNEIKFIVE